MGTRDGTDDGLQAAGVIHRQETRTIIRTRSPAVDLRQWWTGIAGRVLVMDCTGMVHLRRLRPTPPPPPQSLRGFPRLRLGFSIGPKLIACSQRAGAPRYPRLSDKVSAVTALPARIATGAPRRISSHASAFRRGNASRNHVAPNRNAGLQLPVEQEQICSALDQYGVGRWARMVIARCIPVQKLRTSGSGPRRCRWMQQAR